MVEGKNVMRMTESVFSRYAISVLQITGSRGSPRGAERKAAEVFMESVWGQE